MRRPAGGPVSRRAARLRRIFRLATQVLGGPGRHAVGPAQYRDQLLCSDLEGGLDLLVGLAGIEPATEGL